MGERDGQVSGREEEEEVETSNWGEQCQTSVTDPVKLKHCVCKTNHAHDAQN